MSTTLSASQTNAWINSEYFAAVVDVRSWNEFNNGHFPYATLVANLNVHGNAATLQGCQTCPLLVYCNTGQRAATAITKLAAQGFTNLFNGQGTQQWQAAGYMLWYTSSLPAACTSSSGRENPSGSDRLPKQRGPGVRRRVPV